eukprot:CAMPEP_0181089442 /NCGR_PEP_ID=MMETSP1071-20121207/7307_1 /TAXON_ID=35127 /ORGANISM="Thalassiosira sp., Strain NH16" /LENGTH=228 /DNA_ID=CAMNT_0023171395 /DNA_START=26 /DNA_END=708 /DNA_ORIENTATION=+
MTFRYKGDKGVMATEYRKERGAMTDPSPQQAPHRQHFFTTPRGVDSGMRKPDDSRDPPRPTFRTSLDDSERDCILGDSYGEYSANVRNEMKWMQEDVRTGLSKPSSQTSVKEYQLTRTPPVGVDAGRGQTQSSIAFARYPGVTQVKSIHDEQRSIRHEDEYRQLVERNNYLEQELANEKSHAEEHLKVIERNKHIEFDRKKHLEERGDRLEQELVTKDSEIAELKQQL